MSVVYDDWRGEDWLPNGGRRCRHLPTKAVFDLWFQNGEGASGASPRLGIIGIIRTGERIFSRVWLHQSRSPAQRPHDRRALTHFARPLTSGERGGDIHQPGKTTLRRVSPKRSGSAKAYVPILSSRSTMRGERPLPMCAMWWSWRRLSRRRGKPVKFCTASRLRQPPQYGFMVGGKAGSREISAPPLQHQNCRMIAPLKAAPICPSVARVSSRQTYTAMARG